MSKPHWGHTKTGLPVHEHVIDHHPDGTAYVRFNKQVALWLRGHIGTMTCFWVLCAMCLSVLPSVLFAMTVIPKHWGFVPVFLTGFGFELLMTWIVSTCFQALCLPALMVAQNLQDEASDARAAKTFEDTEQVRADVLTALDRLDVTTEGGLKAVLDAITAMHTTPAPMPQRKPAARKPAAKTPPAGGPRGRQ